MSCSFHSGFQWCLLSSSVIKIIWSWHIWMCMLPPPPITLSAANHVTRRCCLRSVLPNQQDLTLWRSSSPVDIGVFTDTFFCQWGSFYLLRKPVFATSFSETAITCASTKILPRWCSLKSTMPNFLVLVMTKWNPNSVHQTRELIPHQLFSSNGACSKPSRQQQLLSVLWIFNFPLS